MRPRCSLHGLIVALLALASQLAVGATVPEAAARAVAPLAGYGVICHAPNSTDRAPAPRHQAPDCQICLLCAALTTPAPTAASAPLLPAPRVMRATLAAPSPPARAPPAPHPLAAPPRGPPVLA